MTGPTVEQRILTLVSNLEAAQKSTMVGAGAPHHMLLLQVKELAEIVREMIKSSVKGA